MCIQLLITPFFFVESVTVWLNVRSIILVHQQLSTFAVVILLYSQLTVRGVKCWFGWYECDWETVIAHSRRFEGKEIWEGGPRCRISSREKWGAIGQDTHTQLQNRFAWGQWFKFVVCACGFGCNRITVRIAFAAFDFLLWTRCLKHVALIPQSDTSDILCR